jgi:hypothetical protein
VVRSPRQSFFWIQGDVDKNLFLGDVFFTLQYTKMRMVRHGLGRRQKELDALYRACASIVRRVAGQTARLCRPFAPRRGKEAGGPPCPRAIQGGSGHPRRHAWSRLRRCDALQEALQQLPPEIYHQMLPASRTIALSKVPTSNPCFSSRPRLGRTRAVSLAETVASFLAASLVELDLEGN